MADTAVQNALDEIAMNIKRDKTYLELGSGDSATFGTRAVRDEDLPKILEALSKTANKGITELRLLDQKITDAGIQTLIEQLPAHITKLHLRDNALTLEGIQALAKAENTNLENIIITGQPTLSLDEINTLQAPLQENSNIENFTVSTNTSLKEVDLRSIQRFQYRPIPDISNYPELKGFLPDNLDLPTFEGAPIPEEKINKLKQEIQNELTEQKTILEQNPKRSRGSTPAHIKTNRKNALARIEQLEKIEDQFENFSADVAYHTSTITERGGFDSDIETGKNIIAIPDLSEEEIIEIAKKIKEIKDSGINERLFALKEGAPINAAYFYIGKQLDLTVLDTEDIKLTQPDETAQQLIDKVLLDEGFVVKKIETNTPASEESKEKEPAEGTPTEDTPAEETPTNETPAEETTSTDEENTKPKSKKKEPAEDTVTATETVILADQAGEDWLRVNYYNNVYLDATTKTKTIDTAHIDADLPFLLGIMDRGRIGKSASDPSNQVILLEADHEDNGKTVTAEYELDDDGSEFRHTSLFEKVNGGTNSRANVVGSAKLLVGALRSLDDSKTEDGGYCNITKAQDPDSHRRAILTYVARKIEFNLKDGLELEDKDLEDKLAEIDEKYDEVGGKSLKERLDAEIKIALQKAELEIGVGIDTKQAASAETITTETETTPTENVNSPKPVKPESAENAASGPSEKGDVKTPFAAAATPDTSTAVDPAVSSDLTEAFDASTSLPPSVEIIPAAPQAPETTKNQPIEPAKPRSK